jgi:hypothetical protein
MCVCVCDIRAAEDKDRRAFHKRFNCFVILAAFALGLGTVIYAFGQGSTMLAMIMIASANCLLSLPGAVFVYEAAT